MACTVTSRAAKANSTPFSVKQSDGTTITVRLHGDENFSWYTTMDNVVLARSGNDFFIADIDAIGNITPTAQLAHEKEERSSNEISLVKKQNLKAFFSDNADKNRIPMLREPIAPTYNPPYFPSTGSPTAIVILVEFKDEKFTVNDPQAVFDQYLNGDEQKEMGYGESLNYGSVKKFFTDMSFGKYQPNFDIIGPVTLSKDMAYYGKNSGSTKDVNCSEMIKEACALASEKTDFSTPKYDINADGIVDLVYIIYAGYGESNGADPNTIWAKSGIGSFGTYNGMSVQRYGLNNELNSNPYVTSGMFVTPKINGIGLFCHEFSHCLGLPDLYPYSAAAQIDNQAMEYWSIMDGGEYTYYGYCPTAYTAWEREALGWHSITTLENNATITATPISDGGQSYKMVNNADWLVDLNYISFLRDVGKYFSVNRMLTFEGVKQRLERGLSFIEFNYQLLQSYDFYMLNQKAGCRLQIGGADQWGNIVAGIDLIGRMGGPECYGLTFNLIMRSDGKKMGKSEKGAVFLAPDLYSPYDFFQYWRNVNDDDVIRFMKLFTFMDLDEIAGYGRDGRNINEAKERLAYEVTKIIHGEEEADKALNAAKSLFSTGGNMEGMPQTEIPENEFLPDGMGILNLYTRSGLTASNGEARRLVTQGGAEINGVKYTDPKTMITLDMAKDGEFLLKAGKKRFFKVVIS